MSRDMFSLPTTAFPLQTLHFQRLCETAARQRAFYRLGNLRSRRCHTRGLHCVFRQFMEMLQTAFRTGPFSFINPLKFLENALTQQHWVKELETEGWDGMGRGKEEKPIGMTTGKEEKPIRMTTEGGPSMTASYPANAAEHRTRGYEKRDS